MRVPHGGGPVIRYLLCEVCYILESSTAPTGLGRPLFVDRFNLGALSLGVPPFSPLLRSAAGEAGVAYIALLS